MRHLRSCGMRPGGWDKQGGETSLAPHDGAFGKRLNSRHFVPSKATKTTAIKQETTTAGTKYKILSIFPRLFTSNSPSTSCQNCGTYAYPTRRPPLPDLPNSSSLYSPLSHSSKLSLPLPPPSFKNYSIKIVRSPSPYCLSPVSRIPLHKSIYVYSTLPLNYALTPTGRTLLQPHPTSIRPSPSSSPSSPLLRTQGKIQKT